MLHRSVHGHRRRGMRLALMSEPEPSDYALWVQLANDPSQPEETRQRYRALMEAHVHQKLRQAFRFAAQSTTPAPKKP